MWKRFKHESPNSNLLSTDEGYECYYDQIPDFVEEMGYLPIECRECYKALIFWDYSAKNEKNFKRMIKSLPVSIHGKYNTDVVVFYFKNKGNMQKFLNILKESMNEYGVDGRIQWRVSGRYWQDDYPEFFISAKELAKVKVTNEISMKEWLESKSQVAEPFNRDEKPL
ncbi:hypothetical protein ACFLVH_03790 [Chloroflexota bacterium]